MSRIMSVVVLLCLSTCISGRGNDHIPASILREFANFRCLASHPRRLLPPSTAAVAVKDTTSLIECPPSIAELTGGRCKASKAVKLIDCVSEKSLLVVCRGEPKKIMKCLRTEEDCCWYCKTRDDCIAWTFVEDPGKCCLHLSCVKFKSYAYSRASGYIVSRTIGAAQVSTVSKQLSD